jgi:hypothetical protein
VHREVANWLRHQAVLWWITTDRFMEMCLERVKKGAASHFLRGLSTGVCFDFPQKAIQKNGTISSHQGLF